MQLRKRVFVIMTMVSIAMILTMYAGSQFILLPSYVILEEQRFKANVETALNILSNELDELNSKTGDWAEWDDTYEFIQYTNDNYIQTNLADATSFVNLRVNLMLFIDSSGQVVFGKEFCLQNMTEVPVSQDLLDLLSANDLLWHHPTVDSRIIGVVPLLENPLLIASRPILTSQSEGPIQGALIMGRYLNSEEIEYLSQTIQLHLSVSRFNDSETSSDFYAARQALSKENPVFIQTLNTDTIAGYALITDVYGDPFLVLRVDYPRYIYKVGEASVIYFLLSLVVTGIIFGATVMLILERQVLSRVGRLATEVRNIGKSKSFSERLSWNSTDELSLLADAIDSMMEERLKAIEQLAAMVGHDLRNPLTGIANATYYLRMKIGSKLGYRATEMLDIIDKDVEYSNKIVNDLLEYSGSITLELTETNPKSILKEALTLVNVPTNVQVLDLTEDKPMMKIDADKMKRTFVNIIRNSVEAMREGGKLTIKSKKTKDKVEISFTDTGAGIPKETLERLFIPLFTTKARGMGFGLAICKRVIEAHGGKISVESTVGKGTTFTLIIPIEPKLEGGDKL
jgi:signal transduction histidine kinase